MARRERLFAGEFKSQCEVRVRRGRTCPSAPPLREVAALFLRLDLKILHTLC
jgi:hypothetical protein